MKGLFSIAVAGLLVAVGVSAAALPVPQTLPQSVPLPVPQARTNRPLDPTSRKACVAALARSGADPAYSNCFCSRGGMDTCNSQQYRTRVGTFTQSPAAVQRTIQALKNHEINLAPAGSAATSSRLATNTVASTTTPEDVGSSRVSVQSDSSSTINGSGLRTSSTTGLTAGTRGNTNTVSPFTHVLGT